MYYSQNILFVQGGFVRQKRLPNDQTNLAGRIGLASRYYIKNVLSSDQLIPDEAKNELTKESNVNLLQLNAIEAAMQLMVEDFTTFRMIGEHKKIIDIFTVYHNNGYSPITIITHDFSPIKIKMLLYLIRWE